MAEQVAGTSPGAAAKESPRHHGRTGQMIEPRDVRSCFSKERCGKIYDVARKDMPVMARVIPPIVSGRTNRPDFLARLKKIYKNRPLAVSGTELLAAERDRY